MTETSDRDLLRNLRGAAHRLRRSHADNRFGPALVVGDLADLEHRSVEHPLEVDADAGLRAEVVDALVTRALVHTTGPAVLLTRPGTLEVSQLDLAWLVAARTAAQGYGVEPVACAVVTKDGWTDPFTGEHRIWKRLRVRKHWYPLGHPLRVD